MKNETRKITLASMFIALGIILANVFHAIDLGIIISPMHITVMLAGIILGYKYGLAVGVITPLLNSVLFNKLPLFPGAVGMALELTTYGVIIALVYKHFKLFKNNLFNIYFALILSMIAGRIIYGIFYGVLFNIIDKPYGFQAFLGSVLITPLPGIVLQILLIPYLVNFFEANEY